MLRVSPRTYGARNLGMAVYLLWSIFPKKKKKRNRDGQELQKPAECTSKVLKRNKYNFYLGQSLRNRMNSMSQQTFVSEQPRKVPLRDMRYKNDRKFEDRQGGITDAPCDNPS